MEMDFEELANRGIEHIQEGELEQALECLRQALALEPEEPYLLYLTALCCFDLKRLDEAAVQAEGVRYLAPDWAMGHWLSGIILVEQDRFQEALAYAEKTVELDPELADGWALLGSARIGLGQWKEALDAADFGLALEKDHHQCLRIKAYAGGLLNDTLSADEALAGLQEYHPTDFMSKLTAGSIYLNKGSHEQSRRYFEDAYQLDPTNVDAREGILEAIRHRNPLYRLIYRFELWRERNNIKPFYAVLAFFLISRGLRFAMKAYDGLMYVLAPLFILMAFFALWTWFADPVGNLFVLADSTGRRLLWKSEKAATLVAATLIPSGLALAGLGVYLDLLYLILGGGALVLLSIPVYRAIVARNGGQNFLYHLAFAGMGTLSVALGLALFTLLPEASSLLIQAGLVAALGYMFLGAWFGLGAYMPLSRRQEPRFEQA